MTETSLAAGEVTAGARARRAIPEWLVVIGVGLLGALVFTIPYLNSSTFYYVGDNPESFIPNWHYFGEQLRSGHWPIMESAGWYGGNYAGEAAYTLWNPISLLNYFVVSLFNDLSAAAAFVMIEFLTLLCMGMYLLAREYGASRVPAAIVAIALPICGYTLFYDAAGWPTGLAAFIWVTWFWWAARRHARGAMSPLVPFLLGAMTMTTGNPYGAIGMMLVLLGITIELLWQKEYRKTVHLVVMGACVGAVGALVFLPLLGAMPVSSRQELAMIANDTFMVPGIGDLFGSSAPTYLPAITNWGGALRETLPSTYFIWFAIPLLPWMRWSALRKPARSLISLAVVATIFALLTLGPSNLWLFRWPIRFIEYMYLGLAVALAVLLTAGFAKDKFRQRAIASVALIAGGGYLSFAVRPEYWRMHAIATVIVVVLIFATVIAYHRRGWMATGAVLLVGTIGILAFQTARIPFPGPSATKGIQPANDVDRVEAGTSTYKGTVLQLAQQAKVTSTEQQDDGETMFGNLPILSGHESINRYSGIGFAKFTNALCLDYKGGVCPEAYKMALATIPGTGIRLVDALRVETLVLQNSLYPEISRGAPPSGWSVALRDATRTVWTRNDPLPYAGRVSFASQDVKVVSSNSGPEDETVRFEAPAEGGRLIFARLNWPGYTASVDGKPVKIMTGEAGLVTIDVPAGAHELALTYEVPGLSLGAWILVGAAGVVLIQTVVWWTTVRRSRRRDGEGTPTEETAGDDTATGPVLTHPELQDQR